MVLGKEFVVIKMNKKSIIGITALLAAIALTGCGSKGKDTMSNKLTYWVSLESNAAMSVSDYGETPFAKELEKRLGIDIEYQHPPHGQEGEKFNVMVAMDDLPDIIEYRWAEYPGGPGKAISEGIIRDMDKCSRRCHLVSVQSQGAVRMLIWHISCWITVTPMKAICFTTLELKAKATP